MRLAGLLACLLLTVLALLNNHGVFSGSAADAQGNPVCDGQEPARAAPLGPSERARDSASVLAVFAHRSGRLYEHGSIGTANLWTDDEPTQADGPGFEARWWALNSEGGEDDVVVDVLRYASAAQARATLALATDARCRRYGSAGPAAFPRDGRWLSWVNPDRAYQHDTLFTRGPLLYRISDTPPAAGEGAAGATQEQREHIRVAVSTNVIACSLPPAGCEAGAAASAAPAAGAPALAATMANPNWSPTPAQARAFLDAVAVHAYDVPWMRQILPAASSVPVNGGPSCATATGALLTGPAGRSAELGYRRRLAEDVLVSYSWIVPSEAVAQRALAASERAVHDGCAERQFQAAVAHRKGGGTRVRITGVKLTPLAAPAPSSYTAPAPYRAFRVRISTTILFHTRAGRTLHLPYFEETFWFLYKRAVIALAVESTSEPLPEETRRYLEGVLVGRAEARWGAPAA